jgi:hypothetical protein
MGALGLFISALVKRTQTATVATFVIVLLLTFGTAAAHQFWQMASKSTTSSVLVASKGKAPEAALWLNPFVADLDMICATPPTRTTCRATTSRASPDGRISALPL